MEIQIIKINSLDEWRRLLDIKGASDLQKLVANQFFEINPDKIDWSLTTVSLFKYGISLSLVAKDSMCCPIELEFYIEQKKNFKYLMNFYITDTWHEALELTDEDILVDIEIVKDMLSTKVDEIKIFVKSVLKKRIFKYKLKSLNIKGEFECIALNKIIYFWEKTEVIKHTYQPWL